MSAPRIAYRVAGRIYADLDAALAASGDRTPVYRLIYGKRGLRSIERRTAGGNWQRTQGASA